jgi:hypothetical protein
MMLCQLSYDVVADAAGARTRNPHVNNVVPPAFVAELRRNVTTRSKKRFFLSYNLTSSVAAGETRTRDLRSLISMTDALPCSSFSIRHRLLRAIFIASATRSAPDLSPSQLMEEMGIEPIGPRAPNQHSPTIRIASGSERCSIKPLRSLTLTILTRIQRAFGRPTKVVETFRVHSGPDAGKMSLQQFDVHKTFRKKEWGGL